MIIVEAISSESSTLLQIYRHDVSIDVSAQLCGCGDMSVNMFKDIRDVSKWYKKTFGVRMRAKHLAQLSSDGMVGFTAPAPNFVQVSFDRESVYKLMKPATASACLTATRYNFNGANNYISYVDRMIRIIHIYYSPEAAAYNLASLGYNTSSMVDDLIKISKSIVAM